MRNPLHSYFRSAILVAVVVLGCFRTTQAAATPDETTTAGLVELLVSDLPEEVARGEARLKQIRPLLVAELLNRMKAKDATVKGRAAYELGMIISPRIRRWETGARSGATMRFHRLRSPAGPNSGTPEAPVIRQHLQQQIHDLLIRATAGPTNSTWEIAALAPLCETLSEVADDQTMDWTIGKLREVTAPNLAHPLLNLASSYLGIRLIDRAQAVQGCIVPGFAHRYSENLEADALLESRYTQARVKAEELWWQVRPLPLQNRIAMAIAASRVELATHSAPSKYRSEPPVEQLAKAVESLSRFGSSALAPLRYQQAREPQVTEKAVWEVVIAAIGGQEDPRLVRTLLKGSNDQQELACCIIMAAGSERWLSELDTLQSSEESAARTASLAIAFCHRSAGLPALKNGLALNPHNNGAWIAIEFLEKRAKDGPPREMARYRFPLENDRSQFPSRPLLPD